MAKWLSFAGLVLTLLGLAIAFYLPGPGGSYFGSSEKMERAQRRLRYRIFAGTILIIIGTSLQTCAVLIE